MGESLKNDSSFKGKEVIKPPRHSCSSIATMSTIDLKGLDNTSRIPKPIYTKNRSKREIEENKGFDVETHVESPLSPTTSQMKSSHPNV